MAKFQHVRGMTYLVISLLFLWVFLVQEQKLLFQYQEIFLHYVVGQSIHLILQNLGS